MKPLESIFNLWLPSPLQPMPADDFFPAFNAVYIKRDDLIHHFFSGNKYRKIKYNYQEFLRGNHSEIIAFGGAFSNLLYTLSFLSARAEIPMTFYIRGDGYDASNPTLHTIHRNGVQMHFIDRETYRSKTESGLIAELKKLHPDAYFVPDGGSNTLAVKGAAEIVTELRDQLGFNPDHIVMDIGTAGTFCGVMQALPENTHLTGIPVLKGVNWEETFMEVMGQPGFLPNQDRINIIEDYHFGGFAKFNASLIRFVNDFSIRYGMPADPVYTGKLFFALTDLLGKNYFGQGKTIVCIHGGGSQGIAGFNYLHGPLINT